MDGRWGATDAIATAFVAVAIIALLLLARGTQDHSRYDDAPVTSRVEIVA